MISQNQQQYLQRSVQVLKEHGMEVNVNNILHFTNNVIPENIIREWLEAQIKTEQIEEAAWNAYQAEEGKPAEDEDERLESSAQRFMESQADQDYWQAHQAPWQDHSPTCNCPACCGDEPPEQPTDANGACFCGNEGCEGIDWILDGTEPF